MLGQLTHVGEISREDFNALVQEISANPLHHIVIFESVESEKVVAAGTLLLEKKFIHECAIYGHIEDIVVT